LRLGLARGRKGFLLDLYLELARRGDREGHHHRLDDGHRHGRTIDAASLKGEDRLVRLSPCAASGRSAGDDWVEKVPELQLEDAVEVVHL
jgi:hypothetical protein